MSEENLINVHLYGDGSRNSRLEAEYIYCDYADGCSAYAEKKCFCVRAFLGVRCPFGKVSRVDGGTKQSKKFGITMIDAKSSEVYAKLKYPIYSYVTRIGDNCFLTIPYVSIKKISDMEILIEGRAGLGNARGVMLSVEDLTPENIKCICDYRPRSMMGSIILDYVDKTVPQFLFQLMKLYPEKIGAFKERYPDYQIPQPNWIGRYAKLSTCNRDKEYKDCHGNIFQFDGDDIVCLNYKSSLLPFNGKQTELRMKVKDEMEVKISDNEQVTENTIFA